MTVNLLKRMRCYRGRIMHVVVDHVPPWRIDGPWYATACTDVPLFGGEPYARVTQPCELWSARRTVVLRRHGLVITRNFHDCQECTLAVGG